jgi:subtilisin family serine protease
MAACLAASTCAVFASAAQAGTIEPVLDSILDATPVEAHVSTLVYLADRVDLAAVRAELNAAGANRHERHQTVVLSLQERAALTQDGLLAVLEELHQIGAVSRYDSFWVGNVVRVDAPPSVIRQIARRGDVDTVFYNYEIEGIRPVQPQLQPADGPKKELPDAGPGGGVAGPGPEPGLVAIRAPEAWAAGFSGQGMLVANIDTGVDGNHAALADSWKGVSDPAYANNPEWAFHDPFLGQDDFPYDQNGHGTHTMGTITGGLPGNEVGVAPDAEWIASASIDRGGGIPQTVADALLSFQWIVDPDGNPNTSFDVPHVVSNSWGLASFHGYPNCEETFWSPIDAAEAAGVVVVFAAGNEGSGANTLRRPADRATDDFRTYAVAAVDGNNPSFPIAGFSSRGPTNCTPSGDPAIKPDISAPGVNVISSVPGGGYSSFSGTSMASPHIAGVIALVRQACPDLTVEDVKQILFDTAVDLGPAGEDNSYGWGIVDAYEAVQLALGLCGPSPPRANDGYYETGVDSAVMVTLNAIDYDGEPNPVLTYKIVALPGDPNNSVIDPGTGNPITPGELPYTLVNNGNQVEFVPSNGFWGQDTIQFVANDGGTPPDGGDSEEPGVVTVQVQFDPPIITTAALPKGFLNAPYGPVQLEADQGQPQLAWTIGNEGDYEEDDLGFNLFQNVGVAQGWHADDNAWSYNLPFNFPFYGNEYSTIYISSNGFINFGSSSSDWSNTDAELIGAIRIAPLWDDLRTDQGGADIYIENLFNTIVTIRWNAVTYADGNFCNFAVQLYSDGRIRFLYGSGNDPITPTVGVSSGDGTHYTLSMYNNSGSLDNVSSLEIFSPATLPEGVTLSPEGILSGVPTEAGDFTPRFRVTDSLGRTDTADLLLTVNDAIPGDIDGNGVVDINDLLDLLGAWGACPDPCPPSCDADLDGDCDVGITDLLTQLANWS